MGLLSRIGLGFIGKFVTKLAMAILVPSKEEAEEEMPKECLEGIVTTDPEIEESLEDLINQLLKGTKTVESYLLKKNFNVNYILSSYFRPKKSSNNTTGGSYADFRQLDRELDRKPTPYENYLKEKLTAPFGEVQLWGTNVDEEYRRYCQAMGFDRNKILEIETFVNVSAPFWEEARKEKTDLDVLMELAHDMSVTTLTVISVFIVGDELILIYGGIQEFGLKNASLLYTTGALPQALEYEKKLKSQEVAKAELEYIKHLDGNMSLARDYTSKLKPKMTTPENTKKVDGASFISKETPRGDVKYSVQADGSTRLIKDPVKGEVKSKLTGNDIQFSDKFSKPAYKNQVAKRGWTNESIAETVNNPVKTGITTNKHTGNSVTVYYCDDVHYVAIDNGTHKVIQVADLSKENWVLDLNK